MITIKFLKKSAIIALRGVNALSVVLTASALITAILAMHISPILMFLLIWLVLDLLTHIGAMIDTELRKASARLNNPVTQGWLYFKRAYEI